MKTGRLNILVTNDDGFQKPSFRVLVDILGTEHNVYAVAPLQAVSSCSHSIRYFHPMQYVRNSSREFALDGTPAACVKSGIRHFFKNVQFDYVLSGINMGANLGEDVFYSGTIAGAREGLINGVSSIAFSLDSWDEESNLGTAANFSATLLSSLASLQNETTFGLNVNYPNLRKYRGVQLTSPGERIYNETFIERELHTTQTLEIAGSRPSFHTREGTDLSAVNSGYVSISFLDTRNHAVPNPKISSHLYDGFCSGTALA